MRIGLALGGGGARGLAHVGVISALQAAGVPIACIVGTSIGAIVGAIAAAGRLENIYRWADEPDWRKLPRLFFEPHLSKKALMRGDRIAGFLRELIVAETFEDLALPFAAVATDLTTGEEVVMRRGELLSAVRASMSIPGVFSPVQREGRILVDGGIVNPLPVAACRALGADKVIAVDINSAGGERAAKPFDDMNLMDVLLGSFRISNSAMTRHVLDAAPPDVLLQPPVGDVHLLDFRNARRLIEVGRQLVEDRLGAIRGAIGGVIYK